MNALDKKPAIQWLNEINRIKRLPVRIKIAHIIWWDFQVKGDPIWKKINEEYLSQWKDDCNERADLVVWELLKMGYTIRRARKRARNPNT